MNKLSLLILLISISFMSAFSQGVGINGTGNAPDASAGLDVSFTNKGLLLPRMTTAERDAIVSPANSLLIFNTTTRCYEGYDAPSSYWVAFGCIGCTVPTGVTASASPNPICEGSNLTLTGSATGATTWSWTGPNSYTSTLQSPTLTGITTAGAGVYILTASNTCSSVQASTASVTVNAAPTTAAAGFDINPACGVSTATLAGNTPTVGTGTWTVVSGTATITTPSSPTSGVTGLVVPGTATLRWTISNSPCTPSTDDVVITTTTCFTPGCGTGTTVVDVTNPSTGKTWMDRNLGASQAATSSTNYQAYGALFQWGRLSDGHECITWTSSTTSDGAEQNHETSTLSSTDNPGHSNFITNGSSPYDWRSPQNNNLWQGVSGINNPCPSGYRLPTDAELNAERLSWGSNNAAGAFASPLKLPVAGNRVSSNGSLSDVGSAGIYWSSTVAGTYSWYLYFLSSGADMSYYFRTNGMSVRCIKD
jgi:uncharacterized protein (TIGR02145 family)